MRLSKKYRNVLITPLVLLGVPITLVAQGVEWAAIKTATAARWLGEVMPRWER